MNEFSKYFGISFCDRGRSMKGVDCWGLVRLIYINELNIELPSYDVISSTNLIEVAKNITAGKDFSEWIDVERGSLKAFDVVVMKYAGTKRIGHVGLMIDSKKMLHIEKGKDAVIVTLNDISIRERISCFRRHIRMMQS